MEHLLPGRHGTAHRLHHQRQDPGTVGSQHIGKQLVPQHGRLFPGSSRTSHGGLQAPGAGLSGVALVIHSKVCAKFRHPLAGTVIGCLLYTSRNVNTDGTLNRNNAYNGNNGLRPASMDRPTY